MSVRTENLPILKEFVPYRGRCPASLLENKGRTPCKHRLSRAGEPLTISCLWCLWKLLYYLRNYSISTAHCAQSWLDTCVALSVFIQRTSFSFLCQDQNNDDDDQRITPIKGSNYQIESMMMMMSKSNKQTNKPSAPPARWPKRWPNSNPAPPQFCPNSASLPFQNRYRFQFGSLNDCLHTNKQWLTFVTWRI